MITHAAVMQVESSDVHVGCKLSAVYVDKKKANVSGRLVSRFSHAPLIHITQPFSIVAHIPVSITALSR